jgi:hypothetical protein
MGARQASRADVWLAPWPTCHDDGGRIVIRKPSPVPTRSWRRLDQNGILLGALCEYVMWTGDEECARSHWPKVVGLAEFPLGAAS